MGPEAFGPRGPRAHGPMEPWTPLVSRSQRFEEAMVSVRALTDFTMLLAVLAWLAFVTAPFPEFAPWKAKERWSDLPTFENIVKECMLSYDHFFDFDRV